MIWFTSDTHFSHKGIIHLQPRPKYKTIEEMNRCIIKQWNSQVQSDDTVYHLGDFGLGRRGDLEAIFNSLNGVKILIEGNHDKRNRILKFGWTEIHQYLSINIGSLSLKLFHYPIAAWHHVSKGSIHLHGHEHGNWTAIGRRMDVGWDVEGRLFSSEEVINKLIKIPIHDERRN